MVRVDGILAGNAFVCRWKYNGRNVCWITQLVVDKAYRERGLASSLMRSLRLETDDMYGIMSSHPAACLAAAKSLGSKCSLFYDTVSFTISDSAVGTIEKVSLDFIKANADAVMRASPIPYIRDANLSGTLFDSRDSSGLVSGVNTAFFVDHEEPLEALKMVKEVWQWPLGDLPDGHEYLLVLPAQHRRSRSISSTRLACDNESGR